MMVFKNIKSHKPKENGEYLRIFADKDTNKKTFRTFYFRDGVWINTLWFETIIAFCETSAEDAVKLSK